MMNDYKISLLEKIIVGIIAGIVGSLPFVIILFLVSCASNPMCPDELFSVYCP